MTHNNNSTTTDNKVNKEKKEYKIKVPVYVSEPSQVHINLFDTNNHSYTGMINYLKNQIHIYNQNINNDTDTNTKKDDKTIETKIDKIEWTDHKVSNLPSLLLKVKAYDTNFLDGYFEDEGSMKKNLSKGDKVGSDNNFFLIVPFISSNLKKKECQWLFLIYDDPNKSSGEVVKIAKMVIKKVIGLNFLNIKEPKLMEELLKAKSTETEVTLTSMLNDRANNQIKYELYWWKGNVKKQKCDSYHNLPPDLTKKLIEEVGQEQEYQDKKIVTKIGKKEFILNWKKEAKGKIKETIEHIFNSYCYVSDEDYPNLYLPDFIVKKLTPIFEEYTTNIQ